MQTINRILSRAVLVLLIACNVCPAKIIYVDDDAPVSSVEDRNGGANDGSSWENAYVYLQDALADANESEKPVKWLISEGGNGHIYQVVATPEGISWSDAKEAAEAAGGYLATITSEEENEFVFELIDDDVYWHHFASGNNHGPWIGGFQREGAMEPDGGWSWITGEIFSYSNWLSGEPTGYWGANNENRLQYSSMTGTREPTWNDLIDVLPDFYAVYAYVIEYEEYISEPVEIRVAQGVYKPDEGIVTIPEFDRRTLSFQLINGVTLKGGYAGLVESDMNARDIELYETILSGDLNGDDVDVNNPENLLNDPNRAENSYHVVTASDTDDTAIMDGFIIIGGNADGLNLDGRGGGMFNENGNPTLVSCTFSDNYALYGGGMYNDGSSSPIRLRDCTLTGDKSDFPGGGMRNYDSNPTLTNCTFTRNSAERSGGGIYNLDSRPNLTNCIFGGNSAHIGGGMYNSDSNPILNECVLCGNIALTIFVRIADGDITKKVGNGGGMYNIDNSNPTITNCILWGNSPDQVDGSAEISYSDIESDWPEGGIGIIDVDPLFANPGYWADASDLNVTVDPNGPNAVWIDGDYHLKSEAGRWNPNTQTWVVDDVTSPCIDAGDPNMPVGDEPFPSGIRINMGAYGGTTEASKSISDVPEVVNVNDNNNGGQVTLRQGQILAVTLESNPTTGYSWARVEKEDSIFEKFGDSLYFPSEQDDGTVGAGGWEILYFKSIDIGQETLELVYRRSWETEVEPIKTFSIDVVVN